MEQKSAKQLLLKYQAGTATEEEKAFIENWILHGVSNDLDLTDDELLHDLVEIRERLNVHQAPNKPIRLWPRIAAVAAVFIAVGIGGYILVLHKQRPQQQIAQNKPVNDIAPGGNKAILTLADGRQINLADARAGVLASQGKTTINKTAGGEVTYHAVNEVSTAAITYNTITVPRSGKWLVVLPDGSKAWLDASSSIRFPTAFTGHDRIVEITGQAYFEVIHNAAKPFKVIAGSQTAVDLGTHFNINAYTDEPSLKTTLLEGRIKVSALNSSAILVLKPGQQAVLSNTNKMHIEYTDAENAVAWKDNYFEFKKANIQTVMRQYARWYNADIAYEGQIPKLMITGKVRRDVNASESLKILTYLDIHFRIEDKKIIITP